MGSSTSTGSPSSEKRVREKNVFVAHWEIYILIAKLTRVSFEDLLKFMFFFMNLLYLF